MQPAPTAPTATAVAGPPAGATRGHLRMLQACSLVSSFDRFVIGPLLLTISGSFAVSLDAAAAAASWYFLCYGCSQPLWGLCSDRFGRVRTMRVTLAIAAVGGVASALAPSLALLVLFRAFTGGFVAAVVPAGLVYVGDSVPSARRQRTLTDLNAATAVGITLATSLGGVLAAAVSWRAAFLLPAAAAATLVVVLRRLPEPPRSAVHQGGVRVVLRRPWGVTVLGLALVEGSALLGFLTYLAPALESRGFSPNVSGGVVALYGAGLLVTSRVVKRVAGRVRPPVFLAAGALGLAVAYSAVSTSQLPAVVGVAAFVVGAAWASMHSTMQAWATEVVPEARAAMVSLFAGVLFIGSGVSTAAVAPLAGRSAWQPLFLVAVVLAAVFGVVATVLRARFGPLGGRVEPVSP